jgi:hypothetical protein
VRETERAVLVLFLCFSENGGYERSEHVARRASEFSGEQWYPIHWRTYRYNGGSTADTRFNKNDGVGDGNGEFEGASDGVSEVVGRDVGGFREGM